MRIPDFTAIPNAPSVLNLTWVDNKLYIDNQLVSEWLSTHGGALPVSPKKWIPLARLRSGYRLINGDENGKNSANATTENKSSELGAESRLSDIGNTDIGGEGRVTDTGSPENDGGDRHAEGRTEREDVGRKQEKLSQTVTSDAVTHVDDAVVDEALYALAVPNGNDPSNGYSYGLPVSDLNLLIQAGRENSFIADVSKTPPVLLGRLLGNGKFESFEDFDNGAARLSPIVENDNQFSASPEEFTGAVKSDSESVEKSVESISSVAGTSPDDENIDIPEQQEPKPEKPFDFRISPEDVLNFEQRVYVGDKAKARNNIAAIRLLKKLEKEHRLTREGLTKDQQDVFSAYVGWGGLPNAFRDLTTGEVRDGWEDIVTEIESLLSEDELKSAARSTLDAHYTSLDIISAMWDAVKEAGFKEGAILEPSLGATGLFLAMQPDMPQSNVYRFGVEIDRISGRIAQRLYPESRIQNRGFETVDDLTGMMDVVIGNPPFGNQRLHDANHLDWSDESPNIHSYFFRKGIEQLQSGGIQAFIVSSFFMDANSEGRQEFRKNFHRRAELLSAVRLPNNAFAKNAGTSVVTDVLFFQKRARVLTEDEAEREGYPEWVYGDGIIGADPENGRGIVGNRYFEEHPDHILGVPALIRGMYQEGEPSVNPFDTDVSLGDMMRQIVIPDIHKNAEPLPESKMVAEKKWEENNRLYCESKNIEKTPIGSFLFLKPSLPVAREMGIFNYSDEDDLTIAQENLEKIMKPALAIRTNDYRGFQFAEDVMDVIPPKRKSKKNSAEDGENGDDQENDASGESVDNEVDGSESAEIEAAPTYKRRYSDTDIVRISGILEIRLTLSDLLKAQVNPEMSDEEVESIREKLNDIYDRYTKKNGLLNRPINRRVFKDDIMAGNVLSLEKNYLPEISASIAKKTGEEQKPESAEKSSIMMMRTRYPSVRIDKADSPMDALRLSLSQHGKISTHFILNALRDTEWVKGDAQKDWERIRGDLGTNIYLDLKHLPDDFYQLNSLDFPYQEGAYALSGNVKDALQDVTDRIESMQKMDIMNGLDELESLKTGLEGVQPIRVPMKDIGVRFGANWVPSNVYQKFVENFMKIKNGVSFEYQKATAKWSLENVEFLSDADALRWSVAKSRSPEWLLKNTMNGQPLAIFETIKGERFFLEKDTEIAKQKSQEIQRAWTKFVYSDEEVGHQLESVYNETFNKFVAPTFDGSHLELEGASSAIEFRPHQKNGVWRGLQMGNVFFDHAVGSGKTFETIALVMELRRLKRAQKPLITVPNGLVEQWRDAFLELYPDANILVATPQDAMAKNRQSFMAKAAYGDWDAVIIPHSLFTLIPQDDVYSKKVIEEEIYDMQDAIIEIESKSDEDDNSKKMSMKRLQRKMERIKALLEGKYNTKSTGGLSILDICDYFIVDEAQAFKNAGIITNSKNIAGLGNLEGSSKAADLYVKARALQRSRADGGGLIYLTGTPLSNTMAELYNWMRHFMYDEMRDAGIVHFDAWKNAFAQATSDYAFTLTGEYKEKTYLTTFDNLPELQKMVQLFMDSISIDDVQKMLQEAGMVPMPIPAIAGGQPNVVVCKPTTSQAEYIGVEVDERDDGTPIFSRGSILDRLSNLPSRPTKGEDNILSLSTEMNLLSLDLRAVKGKQNNENEENGEKIIKCVDEIERIYREFHEDLGTQLVFLDFSTPKTKVKNKIPASDQTILDALKDIEAYEASIEEQGFSEPDVQEKAERAEEKLEKLSPQEIQDIQSKYSDSADRWSAYEEMRDMLIKKGIPEKEIAFIHDYDKPQDRTELFAMMRSGKMRVLFGSSSKMGAGMNVQDLLVAEHHLDAPYRPLDIEQRLGRILRQGNKLLKKYGEENFRVYINYYVTEGAGDVGRWQILKFKKDFIDQYAKRDGVRRIEDPSSQAINPSRMMAESSGSDILSDATQTGDMVKKLEISESAWLSTLRDLRYDISRNTKALKTYEQRLPFTMEADKIAGEWFAKVAQRETELKAERAALHAQVMAEKEAARIAKAEAKAAAKAAAKAQREAKKTADEGNLLNSDDNAQEQESVNGEVTDSENVETISVHEDQDGFEAALSEKGDFRGPYHYLVSGKYARENGVTESDWVEKTDKQARDMGKDIFSALGHVLHDLDVKKRFNMRESSLKDLAVEMADTPLLKVKDHIGNTLSLVIEGVNLSSEKDRLILANSGLDFSFVWLDTANNPLSRIGISCSVSVLEVLAKGEMPEKDSEMDTYIQKKSKQLGQRVDYGLEYIHDRSLGELKSRLENCKKELVASQSEYDRLTLYNGERNEDFPHQHRLGLSIVIHRALETALKAGLRKSKDLDNRLEALNALLTKPKSEPIEDYHEHVSSGLDAPSEKTVDPDGDSKETKLKNSKIEMKLEWLSAVSAEVRQWSLVREELLGLLQSEEQDDLKFKEALEKIQSGAYLNDHIEGETSGDSISVEMESFDSVDDSNQTEDAHMEELAREFDADFGLNHEEDVA